LKIQEGDVKKEKKEGWKDLVDKDMVIAADVKQKFLKEKIKTAKGLDSTHLINYVMSYKFKKGDRLINVQRIDRALKLLKHFCGDYRKAAKKKFSDEEIVANLLTEVRNIMRFAAGTIDYDIISGRIDIVLAHAEDITLPPEAPEATAPDKER